MSDADDTSRSPEPGRRSVESGADDMPDMEHVPPEALAPSGRSEESLPETAPNPSRRDPQADPDDGSTEIPPVSPDA